ncbi:MAG: hypothetical protein WCG87_12900 [Bacteroidota bacterium]
MYKNIYLLAFALLATQMVCAQEFRKTPAQQLMANTGEDSLNLGAAHSKTIISGYGDLSYSRDFNAQTATLNLNRAVLFVGHQFNDRIALFTELEVEDAKVAGGEVGGEVAFEQAYLKFSLNPRQYIAAGLFVPRIGILNENHLPVNFNGVERPLVEQLVIPATWRELGVAFYGQSSSLPIAYSLALVNGLDASGFQHGSGIREGRAEGRLASANNLAVTAAVQYFYKDWKFQVSGYAGGTIGLNPTKADSLKVHSGAFGSTIFLGEGDVQYAHNGFAAKALACAIAFPDAVSINAAFGNNVASMMLGAYGELAYNLFQNAHKEKWKTKQLNVFARYEYFDLNSSIPSNGVRDGTLQQSHIVAGFGYLPMPNVVIKADIRLMHTGAENPLLTGSTLPYKQSNTIFNLGIGYSF